MSALPELPKFGYGYYEEVDYELNIWHGTSYTAPQMREYGDARAAHARKEALTELIAYFDAKHCGYEVFGSTIADEIREMK